MTSTAFRAGKKNASIYDVARRAGVSLGTVSRVLNHHPHVSARSARLVQQAIADLRYAPDPNARHLARTRHTPGTARGMLGFFLSERIALGTTDPYFSGVFAGVSRAASRAGYLVAFEFVGSSSRPPITVRSRAALGAIIAGAWTESCIKQLHQYRTPAVLIEAYPPAGISYPSVLVDNTAGARAAAEHLLSLGHRNIMIIGGPREYVTVRERLDGVRAAFDAHGIPLSERTIIETDFSFADGVSAVHTAWRNQRRSTRPTAILALNDNTALGAKAALESLGVKIPAEVSIVGFDDIAMASCVVPALTTVAVPREVLGEQACRLLLDILHGVQPATRSQRIPTTLIVRGTTKPLAATSSPER